MRACRAVAHAADRLAQARFSGSAEGRAHQTLVKAAPRTCPPCNGAPASCRDLSRRMDALS
jgi:hypothetical protein